MSKEKRRLIFVHRGIQGTLVRRLLLHWGLFVFAVTAVSVLIQLLADPLQTAAERSYHLRLMLTSFLTVSVCLLPIALYDAVKLSHRFVGPIIRFQSAIRQVAKTGEPEEPTGIVLRREDFWHDLAEDFNQMAERVADSQRTTNGQEESLTASQR